MGYPGRSLILYIVPESDIVCENTCKHNNGKNKGTPEYDIPDLHRTQRTIQRPLIILFL